MERTGRLNPHENPKSFLAGRRHWIRQQHRQIQRRKKSPLLDRDSAEATELNRKRSERDTSAQGRGKRSPGADPSDDPPTRKRDEWKARTRTEGDSKAPSASIATSTCRKAGARGKHTRDDVTTPGSVRGEEKRREQAPGNRPEERMGPQDTASLARYRHCGGRATPKLKKETT